MKSISCLIPHRISFLSFALIAGKSTFKPGRFTPEPRQSSVMLSCDAVDQEVTTPFLLPNVPLFIAMHSISVVDTYTVAADHIMGSSSRIVANGWDDPAIELCVYRAIPLSLSIRWLRHQARLYPLASQSRSISRS